MYVVQYITHKSKTITLQKNRGGNLQLKNILASYLSMQGELLRMVSSGMLRRVAFVRTDVSVELIASSIRVTRIGELGTTLAVTSNRRMI
jgi:DNA-binding NtrC family response regulator